MKLTGTIRRGGLNRTVLVLETADGARYLLGGATKALRQEGARVEVEGEVDPEGVSIEMSGEPVFRVKSSRVV